MTPSDPPITPGTPRLNPIDSVMERLCLGRSTVFGLIHSGELRSVKVGKRRLIPESALTDFIARLETGPERS